MDAAAALKALTSLGLAPHLQSTVQLASKHVPAHIAMYVVLGFTLPGALVKIFAPSMMSKGGFGMLPNWFWLPCALWEIAAAVLTTVGPPEYRPIGFYLMCAYLGGTSCAAVVLNPSQFPAIIGSAICLAATAVFSLSNGIKATELHIASYAGGFLAGIFFGVLCGKKVKAEKKSK